MNPRGGQTNLDDMVLLCTRHHTAHHAGLYQIQIRNGLPWVRLPAWIDPTRPWLKNTTHHDHHHTTRRLTDQLTAQQPLPWEQDLPWDEPADETRGGRDGRTA